MIEILLFASLKEKTGHSKISWDEAPLTVNELKEKLKRTVPGLEEIDHLMIAVNEVYALEGQVINEGDVVALIPPVSGG
ncbi:molybdopterin synthase sulfur carrier subunit [Scopulibacillus daqui]|uniref:Molybdopterin synthase sulfur carrier subunit n=1 Tax=Scopulibacillus daqui TaxID=1469162 RepID=A0ABS2PVC6_9BACL|nr:molybdopterin converting factor subunit 1 [Scopulibacillus daqui]MBM7644008.1 molybdopterin synthase sulfur carrier subunit [Scopulibacillus daqui]